MQHTKHKCKLFGAALFNVEISGVIASSMNVSRKMSGSHPPTNDIEKGRTYENVFLHHSAQDISSDVFPICILHRLMHNKSPVIDPHESVSVAYAKRKQTRSQSRAPALNE
jgi:hypothetical protein